MAVQREGESEPELLGALVHRILEGAPGVEMWHLATTRGLSGGILFVDRFSRDRDNGYCKYPSIDFQVGLLEV